jgi:chaperone BCS1
VLNLNDRGLTDDRLSYLLATTPPRSLLLLEDVDAAFSVQREGRAAAALVTFSGLLNALDGVASTEERVTFLTTNHRTRLDAALIRPGRVDVQQLIGLCSPWQMAEMWRRFYGDAEDWEAMGRQLLQRLEGLQVSVAELQGFFLLHKGDAQGALAASAAWRREKEEDEDASRTAATQSEQQSAAKLSLQEAVDSHRPPSSSFIMSR